MSVDRLQRVFLLLMAFGLVPIALAYGIAPSASMPWLYGIDVTDPNLIHIFRAVMGLYLAMVVFWITGAMRQALRMPALWGLLVFVSGIGLGRLASLFLDGWPHPLLLVYLVLEFIAAIAAILLIRAGRDHCDGPAAQS